MRVFSVRCAPTLKVVALALVGPLLSTHLAAQVILHVDDDAGITGDGLSWNTAFDHLQDALGVAAEPGSGVTEIRMAQGRYVPTARTDPDDPRSATFQLLNGVALRGGFAGTAAKNPDANDPALFVTTLSGDVLGDDQPDFANTGENVYHVLIGSGTDASSTIDGFVITGGNANTGKWPETTVVAGGLLNLTGSPRITRCHFRQNWAESGGALYNYEGSSPVVEDCVFESNSALDRGGAMRNAIDSSPSIARCVFRTNTAGAGGALAYRGDSAAFLSDCEFESNEAFVGGGIHVQSSKFASTSIVERCRFVDNYAAAGAGGAGLAAGALIVRDCEFRRNETDVLGGGLVVFSGGATISRTTFIRNSAEFLGGGLVAGNNTNVRIRNCLFSRNAAPDGGGLYIAGKYGQTTVLNCTFAGNLGNAVTHFSGQSSVFDNCILWGNSPAEIVAQPATELPVLNFCDIQGGWSGPGANNINADPLYVQPGCDNLRLAHNSPCINAGSNALVPTGIVIDLAGNPRIQDGTVDMGAYEGGHEPLPPTACDDDFDQGEFLTLVPSGGPPNPLFFPMAFVANFGGSNNTTISVTETLANIHPNAGGYTELGSALMVDTTLVPGGYFMRLSISFDFYELDGVDPTTLDLTWFNPNTGDWDLAAIGNTVPSPGHPSAVGDRIVVVDSGTNYGLSFEIGDYGVFWNPAHNRGFVWANVDHAGDFAFGVPLPQCLADCAQPPDGMVNVADLTAVIQAWGSTQPGIPQDVNDDGIVNVNDLLAVVGAWGTCP